LGEFIIIDEENINRFAAPFIGNRYQQSSLNKPTKDSTAKLPADLPRATTTR
jgi:hypothetical protein